MTTYKKWNKKEIAKLKVLWNKGKKLREIAEHLDRSMCSVSGMVSKLQKQGILSGRHKKKVTPTKGATKKDILKNIARSFEDDIHKDNHPFRSPYDTKGSRKDWSRPIPIKTADKINDACIEVRDLLLAKNKAYGDSAFTPIRIFSKSDAQEQLKVRIDDKLNRLLQGDDSIEADEDVIKDLVGYLILLLIHKRE